MRALIGPAVLTLVACASAPEVPGAAPGIKFRGGNGSSCEARIRIKGAVNADTGIAAENHWLRAKYPGYRVMRQSLIDCDDEPTDRITLVNVAGEERSVYFEISDFFPKKYVPR
jgi:hypothetical protein